MTRRYDDPKFAYRILCLGMRRVPAVLKVIGPVPDPKTMSRKRLIALLGFAYALGADDCAETAATVGVVKRRPVPSNVVPFARRPCDRPRPL